MKTQQLPSRTAPLRLARSIRLVAALACASAILHVSARAADPAAVPAARAQTGTVEGRVFNAASGTYLNNARVTVEGTSLQAFTSDSGDYQLRGVPAGSVRIKASYAGQSDLVQTVVVDSAAVATTNFTFNAGQANADAKAVVLDKYVVESERFRNAQEIAINEERAAPNIKKVVALDSLGYISDGNIGSFVRFLPGVDVGFTGYGSSASSSINPEDAINVGVRGFGADSTAVMIDGVPVASGSPDAVSRTVQLDALSVNNASRLEIINVATPDMPQNSPGGAINLITRGAFEMPKARYSLSVALNAISNDFEGFKRTPGPYEKSFKTLPNVRFSAVIPLSKKVGVSFSVASDNKFSLSNFSNMRDVFFSGKTTTASGVSVPVTNAKGGIRIDNPVIDRFELDDYMFTEHRTSGNVRVDWRPFPGLEIRTNGQMSTMKNQGLNHRSQWRYSNGVGIKDWGDGFVTGFQRTPTFNPTDSVGMTIDARDREGFTDQGYINARFNRGPWAIDGQVTASESYNPAVDEKNGHFSTSDVNITPGRMDLSGITKGVVGAIRLWDASGNPLNYSSIASWDPVITSGYRARSSESLNRGLVKKYNLNIARSLDFLPFPLTLKVGGQQEARTEHRWGGGTTHETRYIGPTQPNILFQSDYAGDAFGGLAGPQYWVDQKKVYNLFKAHPEYFDENLISATGNINSPAANYLSRVNNTKGVVQTTTDGYGMATARLFHNRLTIITGARQSRQTLKGYNVFNDPTYQFVKMADGTLYRDSVYPNGVRYDGAANANGKARDVVLTDTALRARMQAAGVAYLPTKLELAPDGTTNGSSSNNLFLAKIARTTRNVNSALTQPATPQVQLAYEITDSLRLQLAWTRTVHLPDLEGSNTSILVSGASFQVNESATPSASPGGDGTLSLTNVKGLPEINTAYNAKLSWYPKNGGGRYSVTYYYNEVKNSWQTFSYFNSDAGYEELLASMGLSSADYPNYRIDTVLANGISQIRKGYEIEAVQNLGVLRPLGEWSKGLDVFVTYTRRPVTITQRPNVLGFIEQTPVRARWTGGLSYSARRYSIQARFTFTESGLTYNGAGNSVTMPDGTTKTVQLYNLNQTPPDLNLQANFILNRSTTLFASADHVLTSSTYVRTTDALTGYIPDYFSWRQLQNGGVRVAVGAQISLENLPRLWGRR
jgi:iron complex outermembrane recepter protein